MYMLYNPLTADNMEIIFNLFDKILWNKQMKCDSYHTISNFWYSLGNAD